jgi:hypothetical protein
MHRLGLPEIVLVFPEHRTFLDERSLSEVVERLRQAASGCGTRSPLVVVSVPRAGAPIRTAADHQGCDEPTRLRRRLGSPAVAEMSLMYAQPMF